MGVKFEVSSSGRAMLSRPAANKMTRDAFYKRASLVLFVVLTVLVLLTFPQYGISWDEPIQHSYSELVLRFYTSFFTDFSAAGYSDLKYYGGFFELISRLMTLNLPFGIYETRHLANALSGLIGIFGCWKLARSLSTPGSAFWAPLLLALYPSYYGHMFINPKDIPFAALYVWSLYYLVQVIKEFPGVSLKTGAKFGFAAGLTLGVRVGGFLLLCYLYLLIVVLIAHWLLYRQSEAVSGRSVALKSLTISVWATLIAYAVMLAFWPYAVIKPFLRPFQALAWFSREAEPSPISYIPSHLFAKLPELALVLAAIGLCAGIRVLYSRGLSKEFATTLSYCLVAFSVVFPLVYAIVTQPRLYDEVRHFLFVAPPLFCLLGITMNNLVEGVLKKGASFRLVLMVPAAYLVFQIVLMVKLHPYEYAYYNQFVGGVAGAAQKGYLTEYWATSYKEAVEKLTRYFQTADGKAFETKQYKILLGHANYLASYYFPANFVEVKSVSEADVYLTTTRWGLEPYRGTTIVEVGRFGTAFAVGKRLER